MSEADAGFVSTRQAAKLCGLNAKTLRRRVLAGHLPTYASPRNERVRLLKISDLEALRTAQPVLINSAPVHPSAA